MKKPILIMLVGVFFMFAGMAIMPTIASGDTIWYLQNSYGVCSSCHVENKAGHFSKNDCDRCHAPGAKKQVHGIGIVFDNVDNPDEWKALCMTCHDTNKSGHQDKNECVKCHGPGEKKDVHVVMKASMEKTGETFYCMDCHAEPVVPQGHETCNNCHGYMK